MNSGLQGHGGGKSPVQQTPESPSGSWSFYSSELPSLCSATGLALRVRDSEKNRTYITNSVLISVGHGVGVSLGSYFQRER